MAKASVKLETIAQIYLDFSISKASSSLIRPQTGHLEELNKVRLRYMLPGSLTPYAEMHELRNYGHTIAKTEPPTVFLHWSDDGEVVTLNEEFSLTMSDFRKLPDFFLTQAEELCAELMLGLQPEIDLATIKDDMVNREIGFSFIQHPANEHLVSNMRQNLLTQACGGGSPKTFKLFYNGQWSHKAIRLYLKFVTILQEMILGGLHTACGQAPRPTELMEVSYENQASARRNICFWNGSMVYILNHHKSKHTKNKEFYVVRFLPVRLGKVVTIYLIYIRWLVTILENEQPALMMSNSSPSRKHILFETFGKVWVPSRLTNVLRRASAKVWPHTVNSQMYRQLAIGITEKHVCEIHSPVNLYDDRSATEDHNVSFAWQSGHRPLQRGVTYGLDGAFPHQLQPSLLRAYEWASTRWHEFLHLASKREKAPDISQPAKSTAQSILKRKYRSRLMEAEYENHEQNTQGSKRYKKGEIVNPASLIPDPTTAHAINHGIGSVGLHGIALILTDYNILICQLCKAGVRPSSKIESHFRHKHQFKGKLLQDINNLFSGLNLADPANVSPPDDGSPAIPYLPVHYGFACNYCIYMTRGRAYN
ncbi:hypothetical protein CFIMG_007987RA00001 [Ceratocystis fimbriata CBS 114723]|uniref:C2H2-type domain-containing protein n=1 Tax=Ceratocystis fimbriata CBS 114723 TaxID=1035309 RepID=A0A2C5WCJ1_9PEZI|nr:hypothetical protein CFIMG_007987RA00001 [Ceratocystis fimbriata CBS 114723]